MLGRALGHFVQPGLVHVYGLWGHFVYNFCLDRLLSDEYYTVHFQFGSIVSVNLIVRALEGSSYHAVLRICM